MNLRHRLSRSRIAYPLCKDRKTRASHFSSCALIKRAQSPNGIPPQGCNSQDQAARALCGMCIAHLKRPMIFCVNWQKRRTGSAISALRVMFRKQPVAFARQCVVLRLDWGARLIISSILFMRMISMPKILQPLNPLVYHVEFVCAKIATNVPFHLWQAKFELIAISAMFCLTP